jgi:Ca2+-binding RTX toxin-like protein
MMKTYDDVPHALILLAALAFGCAAPVAPEDPNGDNSARGGSSGVDGASGNGPGSGGRGNGDGTRPVDPVDELLETPDVPPTGCLDAAAEGAVSLSLDADVPSVLLQATDGTLHANGIACTDTSGAEVNIAALTALDIVSAGAEGNAVIFDLAGGDWSALLDLPEAVHLEFSGGGISGLVIRGTASNDLIRHGMRDSELVLDLVGDGRINVVAEGVSNVSVDLDAGDDKVDDLSELAAERAAAEGGEGEVVPVTTLALPIVITGGDGNDWLLGGLAADDFDGGVGDDVMSGLAGDDFLFSAEMDGADVFNGGVGYDYVSYQDRGADLTVQLCVSESEFGCVEGTCSCGAVMSGEVDEDDRLINVDDVTGGSGNDTITGSDAADSLSGGPGDDTIYGLGGSDLLFGQSGEDVLDGGLDGDYCSATGADRAVGCEL